MKLVVRRFWVPIVALLSSTFATLSGLVFLAIWSDFENRGCGEIPRQDWIFTANCVDGYNVGLASLYFVGFCLLGFIWAVWSWFRA
jgi:hypothetical protein